MSKVFISFLGTNKYIEVRYKYKTFISSPTPFVQEALVSFFCKNWGPQDRLVFFLTEEARNKNWKDKGNFEKGLYTRLKNLQIPALIEAVSFKEGKSEDEIMENFLTVVNALQEGDEVIFDITHSFRSLPMLNLVALNYAKVLKNISILGIYYGAIEVLGSPREIEGKYPDPDQRIAPVFDLTPYSLLLEWSFAVDEFIKFGKAERMAELIKQEINPILRETQGRDEQARFLRDFIGALLNFTRNIYTCRCPELESEKQITKFSSKNTSNFPEFLPPFALIFEKIEKKLLPFKTEDPWEKAKAAVSWCIEHELIQQGYTILVEAVVSEVIRLLNLTDGEDVYTNQELREKIRYFLNNVGRSQKIDKELVKTFNFQDTTLFENPIFIKLAIAFYDLSGNFRNDINHCGCRTGRKSPKKLSSELNTHFSQICEVLEELKNT